MRLVLASQDPSQRAVLDEEKVQYVLELTAIDEASAWQGMADWSAGATALGLARYRAEQASRQNSEAFVLACDPVLVMSDGTKTSLPADTLDVVQDLRVMSGSWHAMSVAAVLAKEGQTIWQCEDRVRFRMANLSEADIDGFAELHGDALIAQGGYWTQWPGTEICEVEGEALAARGVPASMVEHLREIAA